MCQNVFSFCRKISPHCKEYRLNLLLKVTDTPYVVNCGVGSLNLANGPVNAEDGFELFSCVKSHLPNAKNRCNLHIKHSTFHTVLSKFHNNFNISFKLI